MARKQKFTAAQVIEALEASGGLQGPAAQALGCSRRTLYNYAKRYASVAEAIEEQRELNLDAAEMSLLRAAVERGEAWAVCFYLKTQGKHRGYTEKTEVEDLVKHELEAVFALLEDALEQDEFMKVAGIISRRG
jgi:Bacterial regulatory protein, Fis family